MGVSAGGWQRTDIIATLPLFQSLVLESLINNIDNPKSKVSTDFFDAC